MEEDNLPNLHRKNIAAAFDKHITPFILLAYLGLLTITVKFTKNPEQKKTLLTLTALLAVTIVLTKAWELNKKKETQM